MERAEGSMFSKPTQVMGGADPDIDSETLVGGRPVIKSKVAG